MRYLTLLAIATFGPTWADDAPSRPPVESGIQYRSAFADYRPFKDEPLKSWRQANEDMGRLRGHGGHLGETDAPAKPPTKSSDGGADRPPNAGHRHGG